VNTSDEKEIVKFDADCMIRRLWTVASQAIADDGLSRQDRLGYEADMRLRPLHERLVALGWIVETSTHGSVYYSRGGERLRLSNHEVPWTAERQDASDNGRWSWHRSGYQIITERQSLDECMSEIDAIDCELRDE